jgi:hypothetical protein
MTTENQERPVRDCDVCGISDTDPRHVVGLDDGGTQTRHMDCCRDEGCPDGTCDEATAGAEELRGDALVEHLTQTARSE